MTVRRGIAEDRVRIESEARWLARSCEHSGWLSIRAALLAQKGSYPNPLRLRQSLDLFRIGSAVPDRKAPARGSHSRSRTSSRLRCHSLERAGGGTAAD
jgi:hypothetical protein